MKDIDFDELDRAVNSLMGGGKPSSKPDESPLSKPEAPQPSPSADIESTAVSIQVNRPPVSPSVPAPRRGGRFMDMVPTGGAKARQVPSTPSREGVTITPRSDTMQQTERQSSPVENETPSEGSSWPDPLEIKPVSPTPPVTTDEATPTPTLSPRLPKNPKPFGSDIPLETPFLTDAKVDKRPLGAPVSAEVKSDDDLAKNDSAVLLDPIPEEFNNDLIAIESNEPTETPTESRPVVVKEAPEREAVPVDHRLSDHSTMRSGPTSISQQYKEQPSSGDQSHAAIYDTAHYAEPLNHPAKKRSGWLWVIWVVFLLGIGAGGAILLYNLGII